MSSLSSELFADIDSIKAKQKSILSSIRDINNQKPSRKRKSQIPPDDFEGTKKRVDVAVMKDTNYEEVCAICESRKCTMLYSCGHISVCVFCMNDVSDTKKCPLCAGKEDNN